MTGKRDSFVRPVAAFIPIAAGLFALPAIAPLHAQLPVGEVCVAGNRAPVAEADSAATKMNVSVTINVLANDTDPDGNPLVLASITQPVSGSATINLDQTITFRPATSFTGVISFTYAVKDGKGGLASTEVHVTVEQLPPVLALSFDEIAGTQATDTSGQNNHGVVSGAAWGAPGIHGGGSLVFDGVDDLVIVPHAESLNLDRMTISAWVLPMELGYFRAVVEKDHGTTGLVYSLYADTGISSSTGLYSAGGPGGFIKSGGYVHPARTKTDLPLWVWSHLATTYDGTRLRLYVNGTQVSSFAVTGTIQDSLRPLYIGGNRFGENFSGAIDDVRVYNFALTPEQIRADMGTAVR
jgi:hypothetical protein